MDQNQRFKWLMRALAGEVSEQNLASRGLYPYFKWTKRRVQDGMPMPGGEKKEGVNMRNPKDGSVGIN